MRIVLNATCINDVESGARKRIIGLYTKVIQKLNNYNFFVLGPKDCNLSYLFKFNNTEYIHTDLLSYNTYQRYLRGVMTIPSILSNIKPDIYEQFHLPLIKSPIGKTFLTIHDNRYSIDSNIDSFRPKFFSKYITEKAVNMADKIITVSNYMKNEIIDFYPNNKTSVIYNGFDKNFEEESSNENVYKKFSLSKNFILAVGSFEKRKNYINLLKALALINSLGFNKKLVIVGTIARDYNNIKDNINLLKLNDSVKILHNITNSDLNLLYKNTELFVFPSYYEGFGIPILEAMNANCKIILSDIPVFREITKNETIYFNPYSYEDMAFAILDNIERKTNITFDEEQLDLILRDFSYDKLSDQLINLYKS